MSWTSFAITGGILTVIIVARYFAIAGVCYWGLWKSPSNPLRARKLTKIVPPGKGYAGHLCRAGAKAGRRRRHTRAANTAPNCSRSGVDPSAERLVTSLIAARNECVAEPAATDTETGCSVIRAAVAVASAALDPIT